MSFAFNTKIPQGNTFFEYLSAEHNSTEIRTFIQMKRPCKVLIAPLNWGLGHATRCIPIIHALERKNASICLASDGRAYELLAQEFPNIPLYRLPPYDVTYGNQQMVWNMAIQLPKIAWAIAQEFFALRKLVREEQIDVVISDNRFGCFSIGQSVQTVFMTHQINLRIPFLPLQWCVRFGTKLWLRLFDQCWVPDVAGTPNLSGALSHGRGLEQLQYIGILSRMRQRIVPKRYDAIAVLSGPEPQRSLFETKILAQAKQFEGTLLVVGGKPEEQTAYTNGNLTYRAFLNSEDLNEAILASEVVISRSGYSTLMDLAYLGKRAVLVSTPGQTEQEYLAAHFAEQGVFYAVAQSDFELGDALKKVTAFSGFPATKVETDVALENAIEELLVCNTTTPDSTCVRDM